MVHHVLATIMLWYKIQTYVPAAAALNQFNCVCKLSISTLYLRAKTNIEKYWHCLMYNRILCLFWSKNRFSICMQDIGIYFQCSNYWLYNSNGSGCLAQNKPSIIHWSICAPVPCFYQMGYIIPEIIMAHIKCRKSTIKLPISTKLSCDSF